MRNWWSIVAAVGMTATIAGCGGSDVVVPRPRQSADDDEPESTKTPGAKAVAKTATDSPRTSDAPGQSMSEPQRRALMINKLRIIASAFESFRRGEDQYPDQCAGPLSWRVALLPFIGQRPLYQKFHLNEPWDSPHNRALLKEIPDPYKSVERQDEKTNFLLITGPRTAYAGKAGLAKERCPDGFANTALLAEVADHLAKPWTQPEDYAFQPATAQQDLFGLRKDCCFMILGTPSGVRRISATIADGDLLALLTPAGGEPLSVNAVAGGPSPEVETALIAELERHPPQRFGPPPAVKEKEKESTAAIGPKPSVGPLPGPKTGAIGSKEAAAPEDPRLPIPDDKSLAAAMATAKELYRTDYETAKKSADKRAFAKKLLRQAAKVSGDAAGVYVLLRDARDYGAPAGDIETALAAIEQLNKTFRIDPLPMRLKALEQASTALESLTEAGLLFTKALELERDLAAHHDFDGAKRALTLATNAARRSGNREVIAQVTARRERLEELKQAFDRATGAMHTLLVSPQDPAANGAVGKYLCLIEQNWDKGLPLLARGIDVKLSELAAADLRNPGVADEQSALADRWWEWSEKEKPAGPQQSISTERRSARLRAVHWYKQALPALPANLASERVKQRIAETEKTEARPKQSGGNTARIGNQEPG